MRNLAIASVFIVMGILLFFYSSNRVFPELIYFNYIIGAFILGFLSFVAIFEFLRPDFIITENHLVLSNCPLAYLIRKKGFRYVVEFDNIEKALVISTDIYLKIHNQKRQINISDHDIDDFQMARTFILKELVKRNIPGIMPKS